MVCFTFNFNKEMDSKEKRERLMASVREKMKQKKISQVKLAEEIGVTTPTMNSRLKNDNISLEKLIDILDVIGCEIQIVDK